MEVPPEYRSCLNEIQDIAKEIKRMNLYLKTLRIRKKSLEGELYKFMHRENISVLQGIKREKIKPEAVKRKKKSEKKRDAIELFRNIGIDDPEEFYRQFEITQKAEKIEEQRENIEDIYV